MKALPLNVYRNNSGDCTNDGISSKYNRLLLLCEDGFIDVDENDPPENLVRLVTRHLFGKEYKHIEPVAHCDKGCVGWMDGGNIASTCDSRFSKMSDYPLCIHDRQETQEQYDAMFN